MTKKIGMTDECYLWLYLLWLLQLTLAAAKKSWAVKSEIKIIKPVFLKRKIFADFYSFPQIKICIMQRTYLFLTHSCTKWDKK